MKKYLVLAAVLVASASALAFQPRMTPGEVGSEVRQRLAKGESAEAIAKAGKAANVALSVVFAALTQANISNADVVAAMVAAGFNAADVINAAVNAGSDRAAMNAVAIAAGADPTKLLASTASGGDSGNNAGGSFNGVTNSSFGQSRAATVGGNGRGGVSPS